MDRNEILRLLRDAAMDSPMNQPPDGEAAPNLAGLRFYEPPIMGVAAADDPLFRRLRLPGIVGPFFRLPHDWMANAASVLSFFFPFTDQVVQSNQDDSVDPSPEWRYARIEGQAFIFQACEQVAEALRAAGYDALVPSKHPDFWTRPNGAPASDPTPFASNWSERHVAHVAGLGTFGMSAGLITERGMAGRFGSVVTSLRLEPDARPYSGPFDYCTRCGACMPRCVHRAITPAGKDHVRCSEFVNDTLRRFHPRYGCGKCQVKVPCSRRNPTA